MNRGKHLNTLTYRTYVQIVLYKQEQGWNTGQCFTVFSPKQHSPTNYIWLIMLVLLDTGDLFYIFNTTASWIVTTIRIIS